MLLESLSQMVLRVLRIPPGTVVRHADGPSTSSANYGKDPATNEYVDMIVSITVDDICIGEEPLSLNYSTQTPHSIAVKFDQIRDEFNTVVKWVARDLCLSGVSIFSASISKDNKLLLLPYIDPVDLYLTKEKKVVAFPLDSSNKVSSKTQVKDLLIFVNYNKSDLVAIEDVTLKGDSNLRLGLCLLLCR